MSANCAITNSTREGDREPTTPNGRPHNVSAIAEPVAVQIRNLRKTYGTNVAVDDLSLDIIRGEIFALLGPNGAGKTTTLEILEGYRAADSGSAKVLDIDPLREPDRLKPLIGVMLQSGGIYPTVTPYELLDLLANFYPEALDPDELLQIVGLTDSSGTRFKDLSGGQQRRLALAAAIIGQPKLLFLDEPTAGMDPQARRLTWEIIESQRDRGTTIILTTHFMEEAERLADRIAIVDHGRLLTLETPAELRRNGAQTLRFLGPPGLDLPAIEQLPSIESVHSSGDGIYLIETADLMVSLDELTSWARKNGVLLDEIRAGNESLEDVFLRLTGSQIRE